MKVAFHSNQLSLRGTEIALYDYAVGNIEILGNESFIAAPITGDLTSLSKFQERFPGNVLLYTHTDELQRLVDSEKIDVVYQIISGEDTSLKLKNTKNVYHAVFNVRNPEITAYVSSWLSDQHSGSKYVPHIVRMKDSGYNYREYLEIKSDAFIVGRHGGNDSFDISYSASVIHNVLQHRQDIYFLFLNTDRLPFDHERVLYFDGTHDEEIKSSFINTVDVGLHCRTRGETFGLSVCEYLYFNKPVITCINSPETNHIQIMKDKGFYYTDANEMNAILLSMTKKNDDYQKLVRQFEPGEVMKMFSDILLK